MPDVSENPRYLDVQKALADLRERVGRLEKLERFDVQLIARNEERIKKLENTNLRPLAKPDKELVHAWDKRSQDRPLCGLGDGNIATKQEQVTCPKCNSLLTPAEQAGGGETNLRALDYDFTSKNIGAVAETQLGK